MPKSILKNPLSIDLINWYNSISHAKFHLLLFSQAVLARPQSCRVSVLNYNYLLLMFMEIGGVLESKYNQLRSRLRFQSTQTSSHGIARDILCSQLHHGGSMSFTTQKPHVHWTSELQMKDFKVNVNILGTTAIKIIMWII